MTLIPRRHPLPFLSILRTASAALLVLSASCGDDTVTSSDKNPVPKLNALYPGLAVIGGQSFTLTLVGSNFIRGSVALWNGEERSTVYVASDTLTATILTTDLAPAGAGKAAPQDEPLPAGPQGVTVQVWVKNPEPGGGTSNALPFVVAEARPAPVLLSVSPSSAQTGSSDLSITAAGSGFYDVSVVRWNTTDLATAFSDSNTLQATVPASLLTVSGTAQVTVFTPPPGGGVSVVRYFTVQEPNPVPAISGLNPSTVLAGGTGGSSFVLEVQGSNFVPTSKVLWDGASRVTTYVSETVLRVTVPQFEIADGKLVEIAVQNPAPGGGTSGSLTLTIENPPPGITWISPEGVASGAGPLVLEVNGSGFVSSSTVLWNGSERPTTFVGTDRITASIPATDLQNPGLASVTVLNPLPGGGQSEASDLLIYVRTAVVTNDLVYDPDRDRIFGTVPSSGGAYGNSIVSLDAVSGDILTSTFVGSEPVALARSDDGRYLYASITGANAVRRYVVAADSAGIQFPLGDDPSFGPLRAEDIVVLQGSPGSIAASTYRVGVSPRHGGVFVYDDGVRRADGTQDHTGSNRIEPSDSADILYGYNNETTEFGFRRLIVSATGISEDQVAKNLIAGFGVDIHFDGGRVYATTGAVVDPTTMQLVGTLPASGPMTTDASIHRAFFVNRTTRQITVLDTETFSKIGALGVPDIDSGAGSLIRVGDDGLAFRSSQYVVIVRHPMLAAP